MKNGALAAWAVLLFATFAAPAASAATGETGPPLTEHAQTRLAEGRMVRVIVRLREPAAGALQAAEARRDQVLAGVLGGGRPGDGDPRFGRITHVYSDPGLFAADVTRAGFDLLVADPRVEEVFEDRWSQPAGQTIPGAIGATPLHNAGMTGAGVTIIQFDTGVDISHPLYAARLHDGACFSTSSAISTSLCPGEAPFAEGPEAAAACDDLPECGHGTATAGVMVGFGEDYSGVVPSAGLLPVNVFSRVEDPDLCGGRAACLLSALSDQLAAIDYVHDRFSGRAADVGAIYFGVADLTRYNHDAYYESCLIDPRRRILLSGFGRIPVVVPTGNDGASNVLIPPACNPAFFPVLASGDDRTVAEFSNTWYWGNRPILAAPGVNIAAPSPGGGMAAATGTSIAAAQVTAGAALLRAHMRHAPRTRIRDAMETTGDTILNRHSATAASLLRLDRAWAYIRQTTNGVLSLDFEDHEDHPLNVDLNVIIAEVGGPEMVFAGPVGGPFSSYGERILILRVDTPGISYIGSPVTVEAGADWLQVTAPTALQASARLETAIAPSAAALPAGIYTTTLTVVVDGLEPIVKGVILIVGAPHAGVENAQVVSGDPVLSFSGGFGQDPIWWRWVAPSDGYYVVRFSGNYNFTTGMNQPLGIRPVVFTGDTPDADLRPHGWESNICFFSRYAPFQELLADRFFAVAGEQYWFRVRYDGPVFMWLESSMAASNRRPEDAVDLFGAPISLLVTLQARDGVCGDETSGYVMRNTAWFRWTPDQNGTHLLSVDRNDTYSHLSTTPTATLRVYDESRSQLLLEHDPSQNHVWPIFMDDPIVSDHAEFEAGAGQRYYIELTSGHWGAVTLEISAAQQGRPLNDDFETATVVPGAMGFYSASNRFATRQQGAGDAMDAGRSLWWRWTAPYDGMAEFSLEGSRIRYRVPIEEGFEMRVFTGPTLDNLVEVGNAAPMETLFRGHRYEYLYIPVTQGETYHIRIDGKADWEQQANALPFGEIMFGVRSGQRPAHDDIADALELTGYPASATGHNFWASHEPGEDMQPGLANFMSHPQELGVWYTWVAPENRRYGIEVYTGEFSPEVTIYAGDTPGSWREVMNRSRLGELPEIFPLRLGFDAQAGERFWFRISSFQYQMGNFEIRITDGFPYNDDSFYSQTFYGFDNLDHPMTFIQTTDYATSEYWEGPHAGIGPGPSVWFQITMPGSWQPPGPPPDIVFNTSGSAFNTHVVAYGQANFVSPHAPYAAANTNYAEEQGVLTSRVQFNPIPNNSYVIVVTGIDDATGGLRVHGGFAHHVIPRPRAAILPYARSGRVGQPLTAFMSIVNSGHDTALSCGLELSDPSLPIDFEFRPTNPATNQIAGAVGERRAVEVGRVASFVVGLTPREVLPPTDVSILAICDGGAHVAPGVSGVNSFLISASETQPPDILSIAATVGNTGIASIPGETGVSAFSTAAMNLGASGAITFAADDAGANLPVTIEVCETDMAQGGACKQPRSSEVTAHFASDQVRTFAVFVRGQGDVVFNPAEHRIFARWRDSDGIVRGATSVAVRTVH